MSKLSITKKVLSFVTCSALSLGIVTFYPAISGNRTTKVSAKTIAEIQEERAANDAKIADYDYQLSQLEGDKANEEAYQQTLNEQITLIKANIENLDLELNKLNEDIAATQANIAELDQNIIDQQRYINRLITLIDFIMGASAKGVLVFPENAIPKGMNKQPRSPC